MPAPLDSRCADHPVPWPNVNLQHVFHGDNDWFSEEGHQVEENPGVSAHFVLIESAAEHARERSIVAEPQVTESTTSVLALKNEEERMFEVWKPVRSLSLREHSDFYSNHAELKNANWLCVLREFYRREAVDCGVLSLNMKMEFGSQLLTPLGVVLNCTAKHVLGNRHSYFVKLYLKVDINRQSGRNLVVNDRIYFAEVLTYFRWALDNDEARLLALVKIFDTQKERNELWSYKLPSVVSRLRVVSVSSIVSLCGRSIAASNSSVFVEYLNIYLLEK